MQKKLILKHSLILLIFLLTSNNTLFGQQGNIWYFGQYTGLNFNTSPPTALLNGKINTLEGSSCISDNAGNILFYTDGSTVYNKNHQPMPNGTGLNGDYSSAQSAIIIPKPGSANIYYVFTASEYNHQYLEGYNYNIIDMTLDGGLGDLAQKNILLFAPGTEKLNAVRHANGIDVWVMTKVSHSNTYKAYKIDCNGINTNPVISSSGNVVTSYINYDDGGLIKFSPDGSKLCQTFGSSKPVVQLSRFDNSSGIVSNTIQWSYNDSINLDYTTVEFSPNSNLLYVGFTGIDKDELYYTYNYVKLFQYNITSHIAPSVLSTETLLFTDRQYYGGVLLGGMGQMQIAPDSKIYISRGQMLYVDAINNPDVQGTGCKYQPAAIDLGGRITQLGLPTFMPNIFINKQSDIDFTIYADCSTVNFTGSTVIPGAVSWLWDFGDSTSSTLQNPVHKYSSTGNIYTVTLKIISAAACNGFVTLTKEVNLNRVVPSAGFYYQNQCGDFSVKFFDTSSIISTGSINFRDWDFGDGLHSSSLNPIHVYTSTGNFTVKLTVGNTNTCGGNSVISKTVSIETQPIANFTITGGCAASPLIFNDISTISAGAISEWQWDFGDGNTSSLQNPLHSYNSPNTYNIQLKVKSQTGCSSTVISKATELSSKPISKLAWQNTCINKATIFTDSSVIASGSISKWTWDFGDGNVSTLQNPRHTYSNAGDFTIKFFTGTSAGCNSDTISAIIIIGSKPTAGFTNSYQCGEKNVSFIDKSTNAVGAINNWQWDFGDGNTSNIQNPSHPYPNNSTYTAKLMVSTSLGCNSDTFSKTVITDAKPIAKFGVMGGCINQAALLTDSSIIESSSIIKWWWNFGNGTTGSNKNNTITYNNAGQYLVKLVATGANNCVSDTSFKTITIEAKPVADFSIQNSCAGSSVALQNNSTIGYGNIAKYNWDFGNTTYSDVRQPVLSYPGFGNYTVNLTVTSENGCLSNTTNQPVMIESFPKTDFDFGISCAGRPINFQNLSTNDFGNITQWKWEFGNGEISTVYAPAYTYDLYGNFSVQLTAATLNGCSISKSKTVAIKKVYVFAGNDTTVAALQPLQLIGTGSKNYLWTPNTQLNNNTVYNPIAVLNNDFTYNLKGTTAEGCIGYDSINIKVYKGPEIYVPTAFSPNGDGKNDIIKPIIPGVLSLEYFNIYNRWGQLIYSTQKVGEGWNGKWKSIEQPQGAYVWICRIKDYTGKMIERKGSFLLIH